MHLEKPEAVEAVAKFLADESRDTRSTAAKSNARSPASASNQGRMPWTDGHSSRRARAAVGVAALPAAARRRRRPRAAIRFGYAITLSGPLAPGAESTSVSQYKLWQKRVNDAGGIHAQEVRARRCRSSWSATTTSGKPDEVIKLIERLIQQDKVDMILAPMRHAHEPGVGADHQQVRVPGDLHRRRRRCRDPMSWAESGRTRSGTSAQPDDVGGAARARCSATLKKPGQDQGPRGGGPRGRASTASRCTAAFVEAAKKDGLEVVFSKSYPLGVVRPAAADPRGDGRPIRTRSSPSAIRPTPSC